MNSSDIVGKKIYYRESEIGEVVGVKHLSRNHERVVVIETSKNDYKVVRLDDISFTEGGVKYNKDRSAIDNFPALSNKDIENESDNLYDALKLHYGDQSAGSRRENDSSVPDQAYMGSEISNPPLDNQSAGNEADYDKIKGTKKD